MQTLVEEGNKQKAVKTCDQGANGAVYSGLEGRLQGWLHTDDGGDARVVGHARVAEKLDDKADSYSKAGFDDPHSG